MIGLPDGAPAVGFGVVCRLSPRDISFVGGSVLGFGVGWAMELAEDPGTSVRGPSDGPVGGSSGVVGVELVSTVGLFGNGTDVELVDGPPGGSGIGREAVCRVWLTIDPWGSSSDAVVTSGVMTDVDIITGGSLGDPSCGE